MEALYQEQLLALARSMRTSSTLTFPTHLAEVNNPICGDRVRTALLIRDNIIAAAHADAKGCALCEAGAGLWLDTVVGLSLSELPGIHDELAAWLKAETNHKHFTGIEAFEPVRAIKNRHKCVTLAFASAGKFKAIT